MTNKCIQFFISLVFGSCKFQHVYAILREPVCTFEDTCTFASVVGKIFTMGGSGLLSAV
jgi:hypothetical protein